ncbi:helix-turn-helix domain-containing protein [Ruminiclostridium cellulolyticum]|uniref:Transcriptional regulator, XRE family n=1 Tax=Ruminiclostridium cellulolyticum (strain ATCC 35319 / DSM 5812 / JCM 6584 / H10) TaxID=394503 RepID=B8I935_RUMCH|nr:helix-turn-helix transcriptional regulator [Ruminiclostridium cellulolyticum]ACL77367.1 transcriptional regulator, XRE family [Ruminiclostridium cellulolyticum H10]
MLKKIKQLCSQNNLTISELEKKLNFGNGTIHKWGNAQPSVSKVKSVADYFNVDVNYLIYEDSYIFANKETMNVAKEYEELTDSQKALVRSYILLFKNGQPLQPES